MSGDVLPVDLRVVILAAGLGTRLGRPLPKPLTRLADGRTILAQQIENVRSALGERTEILVVVGYKLEQIIEAAPDVAFAYNEAYDQTNTSKSLLRALDVLGEGGVLWLNGDVVFDAAVLRRSRSLIVEGSSFVCVNTSSVGEEEVKYTVSAEGCIDQLSKTVSNGLGEAVGINFVGPAERGCLRDRLRAVGENEYFELGIELAIQSDGVRFVPLDISDLFAVEVDFESDLDAVNERL